MSAPATYLQQVRNTDLLPWTGEVVELVGMLVASNGPAAAVGDFCEVITSSGRRVRVQVIGFRDGHVLSMPLEEIDGIQLKQFDYVDIGAVIDVTNVVLVIIKSLLFR